MDDGPNHLSLFSIPVSVLLPGLAYSIAPESVKVNDGILHLYSFSWLFGILTYVSVDIHPPDGNSNLSLSSGLPRSIMSYACSSPLPLIRLSICLSTHPALLKRKRRDCVRSVLRPLWNQIWILPLMRRSNPISFETSFWGLAYW